MELQTILDLLAEFNGQNHGELARKYCLTTRVVYQIVNRATRASIVERLAEGEGTPVALLWAAPLSELGDLEGCIAVLQAVQTALGNGYPPYHRVALAVLPPSFAKASQGSSQAEPLVDQAKIQLGTQDHKSDLPAAEFHQPILSGLSCATSMNPFTLFLGRLVEHLGAEISAKLVREFAGQSIQFPITRDYTGSNDPIVREGTRTNGKQTITPSHAKSILQPLACDTAFSAPQETQVPAALQVLDQPSRDQNLQMQASSAQPAEQSLYCCPLCTPLLDQTALHKHRSPNRLRGLFQLLTLRFRRGLSG
jgi:hypothetical protein